MKLFRNQDEYTKERLNYNFKELIKEVRIKKEEYVNNYGEVPRVIILSKTQHEIAGQVSVIADMHIIVE